MVKDKYECEVTLDKQAVRVFSRKNGNETLAACSNMWIAEKICKALTMYDEPRDKPETDVLFSSTEPSCCDDCSNDPFFVCPPCCSFIGVTR